MNRLQPVSFRSIDEFLGYIPPHEKKVVDVLRHLISDCIPGVKEKLSYNVPYYYRHSRICFIWPASVPWGNVKMNGVQLGFCYGYLMQDESGFLEKGNRKQVYSRTFTDIREIDADLVRTLLFEAVEVDRRLQQNRKK